MRRFDCPYPDLDAWIELPDIWLGKHAYRRDEVVRECNDKKLPQTHTNFAVAMALLEEWNIPGLNGNPERWDFQELDLRLVGWINHVALTDYGLCFTLPKVLSSPSLDGATATPENAQAGNSGTKT